VLGRWISAILGRRAGAREAVEDREKREFEALDALAPVRPAAPAAARGAPPGAVAGEDVLAASNSFICREAVLGRDQRVAGYEFMLRRAVRSRIQGQSRRMHHVYGEVLVRNMVECSIARLLGHRLAFLVVLDSFLAHPSIDVLPGSGIVLVVAAPEGATGLAAGAPERVRELKGRGFAIGVEAAIGGPVFPALAQQADYFVLDTGTHTAAELRKLTDALRREHPRARVLAKGIESFDDFQFCLKADYALFQGPFITSREDWSGNRIGPQALRVIELLNRLRREADTAELAAVLRQDAVLSYRLMRYINSAAGGLRQPVNAIEHALVLLGRQKIYRWLTLLLFGSAQVASHADALLENALVRGRLMEAADERQTPAAQEELFMVGLFSLLDRVLQMMLPDALKPLQLPEAVLAALLRGEGPYAPLLELALACESADQERVAAASAACGLDPATVNARHFEALVWAQRVDPER
jgi:EAL and modified HD-GYP domain-containing signal transduction protein